MAMLDFLCFTDGMVPRLSLDDAIGWDASPLNIRLNIREKGSSASTFATFATPKG